MDTVFVSTSSNHRSVYHIDKDCSRIYKEPRVVTKEQATEYLDLPLCAYCEDGSTNLGKGNQNHDYFRAIVEATPDAI